MNTQGVNSQISWAEFVRLTQQARIRNNGLTKESSRVSEVKKRADINPYSSVAQKGFVRNMPNTKQTSGAKIKISGGLFDAYA